MDVLITLAPDDPETRETVLSLLRDPYHGMRRWAAEAAAKLTIREAEPVLKEMVERDALARGDAQAALDILTPKKPSPP